MAKGTIKRWIDDKGFGFIDTTEANGKDVFLHVSKVQEHDRMFLKTGSVVNFDIENASRGPAAYNVRFQTSGQEGVDAAESDGDEHACFHNPYTFVSTPPREKAIKQGGFAGDFNPLKHPCGQEHNLDHASLKDHLWTGHIPIKLTTATPLVLLKDDGRERDPRDHQIYDVHDRIPEASLRGMLRSAYEVVTNSRYGCFSNSDKLAYRMRPREALDLIPAIIEDGGGGKLTARLYTGTSSVTPTRPNGPMYAAMLTLYHAHPTTCHGGIPKTGEEVKAEIVRRRHRRGYSFWKAIQVCPSNQSLIPNGASGARFITGRVFITNKNMRGKHDERIFFNPQSNVFDLTKDVKASWQMRIKSYREAHSDSEIFGRSGAYDEPWKNIGDNPGKTAWSPHQYQDSKHKEIWIKDPHGRKSTHDAIELKPGDMVYARCEFDPITARVEGIVDLFPVMISRELYAKSPADLLDDSLKPAKTRSELSPADRLFGWVPQEQGDDAGYKGRVRVVCDNEPRLEIIERLNGALPLTILGQPKPAQGRFYVADEQGPQHTVDKRDAGYDTNRGKYLRGRKQYWHHKGLEAHKDVERPALDYWYPSVEDRTQVKRNGRYQEYRRPDDKDGQLQQDPQNRSITGWIKPDTEFKAALYVQNLQDQEVGALLWLLSLPEGHYFKLGYGKPLGFGSLKIEIDKDSGSLPLGTGSDWQAYYTAFDCSPPATLDANKQVACRDVFKASILAAYNAYSSFDELPFISDFLQILKGPIDNSPIHYPRLYRKPTPEGENFRWFKKNEEGEKDALPSVDDPEGLPYEP